MSKFILSLSLFLFNLSLLQAQNTGDYRSITSGDWHDASTWQRFNGTTWQSATTTPKYTDGVITIKNPDFVTSYIADTADQVVIEAGGTLSLEDWLTIQDGAGTDLICNGTLMVLYSRIQGAGSVLINGTMIWPGGTLGAPVTIAATAKLNMFTNVNPFNNDDKYISNVLTNAGTISWSGGSIYFLNGMLVNRGTLINSSNGTFDNLSGTNVFNNSGTFAKTGGKGTTSLNVNTINSGTINIDSGTVDNGGTFINTGLINILAAANFSNNGMLNLNTGTTLTGGGTLLFNATESINASLNVTTTLVVAKSLGTTRGTELVTINGTMNWTGGTLGSPFSIAASAAMNVASSAEKYLTRTLTNNGLLNWSNGSIYLTNGTLLNSGTINNSFDGNIYSGGGTNLITNIGNFNKLSGTGTTSINVSCNNSGMININTGTLNNGAAFTNTGAINISAATTFSNNSIINLNTGTSINGSGTLLFNATENINTSVNVVSALVLTKSLGTTTGTGLVTINGSMNWTGGTLSLPFTIAAPAMLNISSGAEKYLTGTLTNAGITAWSNGSIYLTNGTLLNRGTINNSFDGNIYSGGGTNLINNSGTFNKTGGTSITSINVITENTGSFKGIRAISFGATFTNTGTLDPGLSIGVLTVTSAISPIFTTNSTLNIELLNNSGPGTGNDQLIVGNAALTGNLILTEQAAVPAGSYTIISSTGTLTGAFSSVNQPGAYSIIYNASSVVVTKALLPIKLISFTASSQVIGVNLHWTTATEENADHFFIERSKDGFSYTLIGTLPATGSSTIEKKYSLIDLHPLQGANYYRLKTVYKDAGFEYSKIVKVNRNEDVPSLSIHPNPVKNSFIINGLKEGGNYTIQLMDATGRIVIQTKTTNAQTLISMNTFMTGTYLLRIISSEGVTTHKIIKQ